VLAKHVQNIHNHFELNTNTHFALTPNADVHKRMDIKMVRRVQR